MEELYKKYVELLGMMKNSKDIYESTLWYNEIDDFKKKNKIKGMYDKIMRLEDGSQYPSR